MMAFGGVFNSGGVVLLCRQQCVSYNVKYSVRPVLPVKVPT